ncbi:MAG: winged helix-turn-helix domain-containing protein [Thermoanaerobaculia bacterium]
MHRPFVFGDFAFDPESGELRHDGGVVQLEPQPAKVLRILVERSGEVVPRAELRRRLWDDEHHVEADQGLYYCIRELRRALGESAREPRYIETLRRRGYRFLQPAARSGEDHEGNGAGGHQVSGGTGSETPSETRAEARTGAEPPAAAAERSDATEHPVLRRQGGPRWMVGLIVLALGAVAAWVVVGLTAVVAPTSQAGAPPAPRLAVLTFEAPGGSQPERSLAAAVAGALVSELAGLGGGGLEVVPATSSFAYRGSGKTVGEIGRELRTHYLVEGSVRPTSAGDGSRAVDVRLVDAEEDSIVWIRTYKTAGPAPDPLAETIARDVTASLGLAPAALKPRSPPGEARPAASSARPAGR